MPITHCCSPARRSAFPFITTARVPRHISLSDSDTAPAGGLPLPAKAFFAWWTVEKNIRIPDGKLCYSSVNPR